MANTEQWITITISDIESSMTYLERELFGKAVTDISPVDRTCSIIDDVIGMVRGYISACERNVLSEDSSLIPVSCKHNAIALVRYRLLTCLPGYSVTESRQNEYDNALKFLEKVSTCSIGITNPIGTTTDVTSSIAKPFVYTDRCRRFTRRSENGW